jgi:hypothetical protein
MPCMTQTDSKEKAAESRMMQSLYTMYLESITLCDDISYEVQ